MVSLMLTMIVYISALACGVWAAIGGSTMKSVLSLVGLYLCVGVMLWNVHLEYMGLLVCMVYLGAVVILFMFLVFLVGEGMVSVSRPGVGVVSIGMVFLVGLVLRELAMEYLYDAPELLRGLLEEIDRRGGAPELGEILFSVGVLKLMLAGGVLLVAILGGVMLARYVIRKFI